MKFAAISIISLLVLVFVAISGLMFEYNLMSCFGCDIPFLVDCIGGLLFPLNLTVYVACWIATLCGAPTPFFI